MMILEGAPNFRDMGGIVASKRCVIRSGMLLRSGLIPKLTNSDICKVATLSVGLVCDLRSAAERNQESSVWPAIDAAPSVVGPDAGLQDVRPLAWEARLLDPEFNERRAREDLIKAYRHMPRSLAWVFPSVFAHFLCPAASAVLIRCTAGKDRTGFVCAVLLWALGVPMENIRADYLRSTNGFTRSGLIERMLFSTFGRHVPERAAAAAAVLCEARTEFLDAAISQVMEDFGSMDEYLIAVLGADLKQELRQRLLVGPSQPMK